MKNKKFSFSLVMLWVFIAISLFPLYVMAVGAFKQGKALRSIPPDLNPFVNVHLDNINHVMFDTDIFVWLTNSFLVSLGATLLTIFIAATAGYALSKKQFRGRGIVFAIVIGTMIMPRQLLLIPNFLVALNLGLVNNMIGVILTSVVPSFGIFLCCQFMKTLPTDFIDAAEIDGCGEIGKFIRIIVPLAAPAFGALGIFVFLMVWNDFLWQFVLIRDKALQTVPIGIALFAQAKINNLGHQMGAAFIATVPIVIIFLLFQRFFIKGITLGGVKG